VVIKERGSVTMSKILQKYIGISAGVTNYNFTTVTESWELDKKSLITNVDFSFNVKNNKYTSSGSTYYSKPSISVTMKLYDEQRVLLGSYRLGNLSISSDRVDSKSSNGSQVIDLNDVKYIELIATGKRTVTSDISRCNCTVHYQEDWASEYIKNKVYDVIINNKYIQEYVTTGGVDE
jgi:hypothetical protein